MRWSTYPREIPNELRDPLLDTYHTEGPDVPETIENRREQQPKRVGQSDII